MSSSSPSLPNTRARAHELREKADRLSKSALKLEKNIKDLQKKEAEVKNDIKFHKLEMERQEGYFLADTDKSEKLEKKLRRLQFDINNKEEEGETIHAQVRDTLSELDSIQEEEHAALMADPEFAEFVRAELRKMKEGKTNTRKRKRGADGRFTL